MKHALPHVLLILGCAFASLASQLHGATETETLYLSGTGNDDTVDWEFKVNGGRKANQWSTIPVPSNWEMQGFGTYHYWTDFHGPDLAPDSLGQYRHTFDVPASWEGKSITIVIGAAMTDTDVHINGKSAGPTHQGGFYQFSYEITDLVKVGEENLLEVDVQKYSSNHSVNVAEREADFWLFGGIYRPVWLEAKPASHIERFAVDARHDGSYSVDVFLKGIDAPASLVAEVLTLDGKRIAKSNPVSVKPGQSEARLQGVAKKVEPWSAEWPNRYQLKITLNGPDKLSHTMDSTIGFRTVEVRPKDGIYVNGSRVVLKGSNRHTIWPTSGRATNAKLSEQDALLMKEMNMNAVRMAHYPPDSHFLEVCDRLGLYVIDELTGWQRAYDEQVGEKLVRETVIRDVNHPSVILWANGNEGGWNRALDDDFAKYDPQNRTVIHPWLNSNGINTAHYEAFDSATNFFFHGDDIIMPTEFLHALYDGGAAAGLEDWWNRIWNHPLAGGGFLWAFADEGIVRDDQNGRIDVAGNRAPDGIVGPYREKEGSFFAIKEIWSPVYLPLSERDRLPASFDGRLIVENRYDHTDLEKVRFAWTLNKLENGIDIQEFDTGEASSMQLAPRMRGELNLRLPKNWHEADLLEITAYDPRGTEIYSWNWMLREPNELARLAKANAAQTDAPVSIEKNDENIVVQTGDSRFVFDAQNGRLVEAKTGDSPSPLRNGPIALGLENRARSVEAKLVDDNAIIHAAYDSGFHYIQWTIAPDGWLTLDYRLRPNSGQPSRHTAKYIGITFDYDESKVSGVEYLGKGPYRVWKNRRKGMEYGVWKKDYNDTATGASWVYPEFKGFHEDFYWATLQSDETPLTVITETTDIFLSLFTPKEGPDPRSSHVVFPEGDLSFLHGIAPIGTKFQEASSHGPQGALNLVENYAAGYQGTLSFRFD